MASKYKNKKITRDGQEFDSLKEYRRYVELSLLEKAGKIQCLERQAVFELLPAQFEKKDGKRGKCLERAVKYVADFVYFENGKSVVEDTKGVRTKDYIIKRKLMLYFHGIKIREI
ncbi:MAG: DUF1064 domain-containing protein [Clostridia bacterium]|nr:DUF1064 domain-containing protein [Clostridia bacterium]